MLINGKLRRETTGYPKWRACYPRSFLFEAARITFQKTLHVHVHVLEDEVEFVVVRDDFEETNDVLVVELDEESHLAQSGTGDSFGVTAIHSKGLMQTSEPQNMHSGT
jgi:hypothetical protein